MAYTSRIIHAPIEAVWDIVIDPETYPRWLIGAEAIRSIDADWPAVGSRFRHLVGFGWLAIPDHSEVEHVVEPTLLQLAVRARPLISATVWFRLVSDGTTTVITLEEEPKVRSVGSLVRPLLDPSIHVRNHRSLLRLDALVRERIDSVTRV